ncbi:unnamed protein product [Linum tenue]|nr:unnamed protein product [Linum tenue]
MDEIPIRWTKDFKKNHLRSAYDRLNMHLQVEDISEEAVQDYIDGLLQIQVKQQRSKLKKIFLECRDAVEARTMKPPGISQKNWDDLIDYWLCDKAKRVAVANTQNRQRVKVSHRQGCKAFVVLRNEIKEANNGEECPIAPSEVVDSEEVQDNVDIAPSTRSILRLRDRRRRSSFVRDIAGAAAHSPSCSGSPSTLPRRCGGGTTTRQDRPRRRCSELQVNFSFFSSFVVLNYIERNCSIFSLLVSGVVFLEVTGGTRGLGSRFVGSWLLMAFWLF